MKKRVVCIAFIVMLCICAVTVFTACWGSNALDEKQSKNLDITIYVDDNPETFMVTVGAQAEITSFTKSGYYLTGIYDQEEGGTKYFDSNGRSLGIWQKNNPTTFYAQWEIFSAVSKTFDTRHLNNPYHITSGESNSVWIMTDELLNAVNGNYDKNLHITLTFEMKGNWENVFSSDGHKVKINIKDTTGKGAELFGTKNVAAYYENYETHSLNWTVSARCGRTGSIVVGFSVNAFEGAFLRNLILSVSFV